MRVTFLSVMALIVSVFFSPSFAAVGFQEIRIDDQGQKPLSIFIWYPSSALAKPVSTGPWVQTVALDGPVLGTKLPLIVMSHGSSDSPVYHYDLAMALAESGFVVAAPLHTGDNYADSSDAGFRRDLINRPRHVVLAIDYH